MPEKPRNQSASFWDVWPFAVASFVGALTLAGGISTPGPWALGFQTVLSLFILFWALLRLAVQGFPTVLAVWASTLAMFALVLIVLQLVPLPSYVWQLFPGRELVVRNLSLIGSPSSWSPLSLSPANTMADGVAVLPALASFFALLTVRHRHLIWICAVFVGCAIIGVIFSLLQHFEGSGSTYYWYDDAGGIGVGTFNNRNFFAAQLYASIPILSVLAIDLKNRRRIRPVLLVLSGLVYGGIILVGLSMSASRTGILLAMPAVLFAVLLAYSKSSGQQRLAAGTYGLLAVVLGFFVVGQASMVGLLRLVQSDPMSDYRTVISRNSLGLAARFFPTGGGFGSFVPLYQLGETPETMRPEFVNHAHNDWLELVIEGGLPAVVLLAAFLIWLAFAEVRVWRYGQGGQTASFQRMASLVLPLLLLHSLVDFPLRTPALLVLFGFCCGVLCLQPDVARQIHTRGSKNSSSPRSGAGPEIQPFRRPQTGFGAAVADKREDSLQ